MAWTFVTQPVKDGRAHTCAIMHAHTHIKRTWTLNVGWNKQDMDIEKKGVWFAESQWFARDWVCNLRQPVITPVKHTTSVKQQTPHHTGWDQPVLRLIRQGAIHVMNGEANIRRCSRARRRWARQRAGGGKDDRGEGATRAMPRRHRDMIQ